MKELKVKLKEVFKTDYTEEEITLAVDEVLKLNSQVKTLELQLEDEVWTFPDQFFEGQ